MDAFTVNVITTAVAPIVMVSAAGLLFIGVQTKNLHLADRIRDLTKEYRTARGPEDNDRREAITAQIRLFERRLRLSQRALELLYGAIGCFIITALLLAATPWIARVVGPIIGGMFILGIAGLLLALALEFIEMRAGLETIAIEIGATPKAGAPRSSR